MDFSIARIWSMFERLCFAFVDLPGQERADCFYLLLISMLAVAFGTLRLRSWIRKSLESSSKDNEPEQDPAQGTPRKRPDRRHARYRSLVR